MNNFPKHWQVKKLGEVCEIKMGQSPKGESVSDSLLNLKEALEFHQGKIYFSDKFILKSKFYTSEIKKVADENSILLCVRAPVGIVNLTDRKIAIGRGLCALKAKNFNNMFLYYFLINSKAYFEANSTGTTFSAINLDIVRNLKIPFPSLYEQNLIVKKIEDCFKKIDFAVLKLKKSKELVEIYKQSVLSHAFNGKLTNSNLKHWQVKKLKDIGKISSGGTPPTSDSENFGGNIAWITPADLSNHKDKFISHGKRNLSEKGLKNSSAKIMPKGTVLFSSRAPIGYVAISANEICTNQGFKSITPNSSTTSEFIYYYLLGSKNLAEKFASGTTFKEISASSFSMLPIPLPPLHEQNQIVSEIQKRFETADNALNLIKNSLEKAEILKQSILQKAFNGELVKDKNE